MANTLTAYLPSDIQGWQTINRKNADLEACCETLGKFEYEHIAYIILKKSQEAGLWIPVKGPFFTDKNDSLSWGEADVNILEDMIKCGYIRKMHGGYALTNTTIERIVEKYPSSHR